MIRVPATPIVRSRHATGQAPIAAIIAALIAVPAAAVVALALFVALRHQPDSAPDPAQHGAMTIPPTNRQELTHAAPPPNPSVATAEPPLVDLAHEREQEQIGEALRRFVGDPQPLLVVRGMTVGDIGSFPYHTSPVYARTVVAQVIDEQNMLASIELFDLNDRPTVAAVERGTSAGFSDVQEGRRNADRIASGSAPTIQPFRSITVWVSNVSTADLADSVSVTLDGGFLVSSTKQYESLTGPRTVYELKALRLEYD